MKFVFFGTPEFAAIILEKLINAGFIPEAVVCNPDRPVGRKKIITPPVAKIVAQKYSIPIWQPEKLPTKNPALSGAFVESRNNPLCPKLALTKSIDNDYLLSSVSSVDNHKSRGPAGNQTPETRVLTSGSNHSGPTANILYQNWDFFIVAAYSKIIPKEILEIPRLGAIGVHPSLLPKYRGPSPIQTAILNGDEITGTTLFLMDEKIDHGPILAQRELNYELRIKNYELLMRKLAELSADLLIETLPNIEEKIKNAKQQNESEATYTKKFTTEDAFIEPADLAAAMQSGEPRPNGREKAIMIDRKIRAFNPEPGTWTILNGKRVKILEAAIKETNLKLTKIQTEGKKPKILH